ESFPLDIMHDMLEGVIPNTVSKAVSGVLGTGRTTLAVINRHLQAAGKLVRDKPNLLKATSAKEVGQIIGSAAQKWCLFLILPQVLHSVVSTTDDFWMVYLLLHTGTDILFAHRVLRSDLNYLRDATARFLTLYCETFGSESMTPKYHYMIHYAKALEKYGPLRQLWCMRFESKHQYFKRIVPNLRNYICVSATLSKSHQLLQAMKLQAHDIFS